MQVRHHLRNFSLFIDTKTTGLPKDESLSPMVIDNWPRLVSIAYILCDEREIVDRGYFIIKPNKFIIPIESTKIHGITTAEAVSKGIVLSEVLDIIRPLIEKCDYIVGHNVVFDINVLNAEFYRYNMTLPVSLKPYYCTMLLSKDYCGLPNNKYPTLEELYSILKGESISYAHNAMTDTQVSMECFWILKDSGIVGSMSEKPTIILYPTADNISWAAEHVSLDYSAKAYAFLTLVSNLTNNKSNFLITESNTDLNEAEKWLNALHPECVCAINPESNREWTNNMFKFLKDNIKTSFTVAKYNVFIKRVTATTRPLLVNSCKEIEKEVGGIDLINKYKLKYIDSPYATLILEEESCWADIAVEAVKARILSTSDLGNEQMSQADAEKHFISMIKFFNDIRETEGMKRSDELFNRIELAPKKLEKNLEEIKNYSSPYTASSSGCMLLLSLFVGIGSSLCFIVSVLLNHQ